MTGHLERDAADAGDNVYGAQDEPSGPGRIVLVFQGGGALGAYQVGVYKALHEAGLKPDWVIGTSIGAINASLIAGNAPADRLAALNAFWTRVEDKSVWPNWMPWLQASQSLSFMNKLTSGIPGFFEPNFQAFLGAHASMEAEQAGYYSTAPLEQTLLDLVDFKRLNTNQPRLTVGAAHVCSSRMHYFDSRETEIGVKHIMASGALPPAFPPQPKRCSTMPIAATR